MRRVVSAREQVELLSPWLGLRVAARPSLRLPDPRGRWLDAAGLTQKLFRRNQYSWIDSLTPLELALGALWYPVGHEWGEHMADRFGVLPYKVHAVVSATSPQRRWITKNLERSSNLGDAHLLLSSPPGSVPRLGGKSGHRNLEKANAVLAASDDRDSVAAAFLGMLPDGRPKRISDARKTWAFLTTLDDPETGGAGNYREQPVVNDSWAGRASLWSREQWERAKELHSRTNLPMEYFLKYPGKGTGEGLDAPVKKNDQDEDGNWFTVGYFPPSPSDVAARVIDKGGAYERMSNATRAAAHRAGLAFAHEGQAGIWAAISGNQNALNDPRHELDLHSIDHPEELYNEMWSRRASGLVAPQNPGGLVLPGHYDDGRG